MRANAQRLQGRRGERILFSDLSFDLGSGDALVLTGPNGSGKSTLLRIVAGLLPADSGSFTLADAAGRALAVSEAAHYLGHRNAMKRELTVAENLSFWSEFSGNEGGEGLEIEEAIEVVGLPGTAHLPFGYLSAGQQRRIALARLLVNERPLWVLDEPTAALDQRSSDMFDALLLDHLEAGGMAIVATHQPLGLEEPLTLALDGIGPDGDDSAGIWG